MLILGAVGQALKSEFIGTYKIDVSPTGIEITAGGLWLIAELAEQSAKIAAVFYKPLTQIHDTRTRVLAKASYDMRDPQSIASIIADIKKYDVIQTAEDKHGS